MKRNSIMLLPQNYLITLKCKSDFYFLKSFHSFEKENKKRFALESLHKSQILQRSFNDKG